MPHIIDANEQFDGLKQAAYQLSSCTDQIFLQIKQQQALTSIIDRIRSSLDIDTILKTTVTEIRELLKADRVGVLRFVPDSGCDTGEFVAEAVVPAVPSAMSTKVYQHCFGSEFSDHYSQGRIQAVADIYHEDLSECHIKVLEQFQIRANLIVPVLKGNELWGLLCVHQCLQPRRWQLPEIEFVKKIASHFAIALQQAQYLEELQNKIEQLARAKAQERTLFKITNRIRQSLGWEAICKTTTAEVRQLLAAERVAIYRFNSDWSGEFVFESVAAGWKRLVGTLPITRDTYLMRTKGGRYANYETFSSADIYEEGYANCHIALLEQFQVRAHMITPIFQDDRLWGLLAAFQNSAPRQWQADEVSLLTQISEQLGVALQQADSFWKIQAQSVELKQMLEELQQSQAQLVQNEKMASLGQMVAGIAHEINNPVNFIHGNLGHVQAYVEDLLTAIRHQRQAATTKDLERDHDQAEEADIDFIVKDLPKTISSMKMGTERIHHIVRSLRNFSRLDEADIKAVDIHEGIESTLLILGSRFKSCGAQPHTKVVRSYGNIPHLECYPAQLNQVFMNLLTNALDAIEEDNSQFNRQDCEPLEKPKQYKIWISTQLCELPDTPTQINISIRDNGIGIKEAVTSKIFDHFFTTKPVGKGTGLGLSISRQIVTEKHLGQLSCHSQAEKGTEFVVSIPIGLMRE